MALAQFARAGVRLQRRAGGSKANVAAKAAAFVGYRLRHGGSLQVKK